MELTLNKGSFNKEVLESPIPAVVDFWAPWCGPCKIMGPIIEEVAKEYEGKVKVGKVNVDDNQELAQQYGIMSIPTIKIFKQGKVAGEIVGAVPKAALTANIDLQLK
jgi:thioredoxin 1